MKLPMIKPIITSSLLLSCLALGMQKPQKVYVRVVNNTDKLASLYAPDIQPPRTYILPQESYDFIVAGHANQISSPSINSNYDVEIGITPGKVTLGQITAEKRGNKWEQKYSRVQEIPFHAHIDAFISANGAVVLFPSFKNLAPLTPEEILGVQKGASPDDIKKAYRDLSFKLHPDKHNNSPEIAEIYKRIVGAYQQLGGK